MKNFVGGGIEAELARPPELRQVHHRASDDARLRVRQNDIAVLICSD